MSGHNKWSTIKHKKGAADAKRGRVFTRLVKEITIAARNGSGDLNSNPRLRTAVDAAKNANMPNSNIEHAIKRGTGELEGVTYEEYTYEGYGQNGVAILVEVATDNKNRTVAEVRHAFSKYGGQMAESGSVAWVFSPKGYILIDVGDLSEDDAIMEAIEAGAEDASYSDGKLEIYTEGQDFHKVYTHLKANDLNILEAELIKLPSNTISADDVAEKLLKLIEKLEDLDDVQKVYANYEISDEIMNRLAES